MSNFEIGFSTTGALSKSCIPSMRDEKFLNLVPARCVTDTRCRVARSCRGGSRLTQSTHTTRRSTTLSSTVNLNHASNFRAKRGANLVTQHPGIDGEQNPRAGCAMVSHAESGKGSKKAQRRLEEPEEVSTKREAKQPLVRDGEKRLKSKHDEHAPPPSPAGAPLMRLDTHFHLTERSCCA